MRAEQEPNLVHFALVGVQNCGTTSLADVLDRHPQLCLAQGEEAHLFDRADAQRAGFDRHRFDSLFAHRRPDQLQVDETPSYLFLPGCSGGPDPQFAPSVDEGVAGGQGWGAAGAVLPGFRSWWADDEVVSGV